ncbi:MAG: hypothetical protein WCI27_05415 [Candidatus Omnitrophota bacterium]
MRRYLFVAISFLLLNVTLCEAASVKAIKGNIFYTDNVGKILQLTSSGRDQQPVIQPKNEWIYFVRSFDGKFKGEKYCPPKGKKVKPGVLKEELWRVKKDGTSSKMLYRAKNVGVDGPDENYSIASISNIQFAPDGDKVYVETSDSATSSGVHVMNPEGGVAHFLGGGNQTKIILSSSEKSYRGCIVTSQHHYFLGGGAYDWYYLFTPDMKKKIGVLGEDLEGFTKMYDVKYTDGSEKNI